MEKMSGVKMKNAVDVVIDNLTDIFLSKGIRPPSLLPSSPIDSSLGLDSLDFAELAVRLETHYGRDPFLEGDIPPLNSISDLAALYESH